MAYGGNLGPDPRSNNGDEELETGKIKGRGKRSGNGRSRTAALARVIRFANRVPLLYQQSSCCIFKSVVDTDWRRYGLSQSGGALPAGPLVVMVHMARVWVPFTSESKEAIADYDEIRQEIRLGLQICGRKLSAYLNRRRKQRYQGERRGVFERYIKEVVNACDTIKRINKTTLTKDLFVLARKMTAQADEQLDGHGKPVKPGHSEFGENTVVVDSDDEPAGELFAMTTTAAK